MAGCKPEYAPVVRAAMLALCETAFNLNGVQATTHMASPLLVVNGPIARRIGMNAGCNAFGSGNRANATIGRAIRLMLTALMHLARPALLALGPETAHETTLMALEKGLHPADRAPDPPTLAARLGDLALANPMAIAAGFDKDARVPDAVLNLGCGWPGDLDKSTLGHPGKYTYAVAENEELGLLAPYHVEKGFKAEDSTVFVMAAEPPHSVTNHVANDPQGILDSIVSAMSTFAHNNAVSSGHCAVVLGPEHATTISKAGWKRHDVKQYLWTNAHNTFGQVAFNHRYGKVYNRSLPVWYGRELDSRIPVVPSAENIHLFVIGGEAGRFSAFIPGWGHMSSPVLREIEGGAQGSGPRCVDGTCYL
jgi:hypothetical protein